jgi:hypothetical protein
MVSETDGVVSIYKVNSGPQLPHASSFINPNNNKGFTTKEEKNTVSYSYTIQKREPSSHGLNVSPINNEHE